MPNFPPYTVLPIHCAVGPNYELFTVGAKKVIRNELKTFQSATPVYRTAHNEMQCNVHVGWFHLHIYLTVSPDPTSIESAPRKRLGQFPLQTARPTSRGWRLGLLLPKVYSSSNISNSVIDFIYIIYAHIITTSLAKMCDLWRGWSQRVWGVSARNWWKVRQKDYVIVCVCVCVCVCVSFPPHILEDNVTPCFTECTLSTRIYTDFSSSMIRSMHELVPQYYNCRYATSSADLKEWK
jgi:hypothetical protein